MGLQDQVYNSLSVETNTRNCTLFYSLLACHILWISLRSFSKVNLRAKFRTQLTIRVVQNCFRGTYESGLSAPRDTERKSYINKGNTRQNVELIKEHKDSC